MYHSHNFFCFASLYLCLPLWIYSVCNFSKSRIDIVLVKPFKYLCNCYETLKLKWFDSLTSSYLDFSPALCCTQKILNVFEQWTRWGFWGSASQNARNLVWVFQPCLWKTRAVCCRNNTIIRWGIPKFFRALVICCQKQIDF